MIASGRVAKIEGELALQRRLVDEMKSGQAGNRRLIVSLHPSSPIDGSPEWGFGSEWDVGAVDDALPLPSSLKKTFFP